MRCNLGSILKYFKFLTFYYLILLSVAVEAQSRKKGIEMSDSKSTSGRKFALVIGINAYQDPQIGDLDKAENDATGVAKILAKYGSFDRIQTILGGGPSQVSGSSAQSKFSLEAEYDKMITEMQPEDSLIFYFSGHGMTDYDEKTYLLAADSELGRLIGTSIALEDLIQRSREKGLKKVIFILDACRNPDKTTQISGPKFLKNTTFNDAEQVAVLYSTKLGYYSYEDDKSAYGVFTKYLIYGLEGRADSNFNAEITFTELSDYVTNSLKDWSATNKKNQKPYVKYYSEKSGDIALTYASNPEFSLADLKIYDPYDNRYLYRSLVLPGWGQYARGEETKGRWMMWTSGVLYSLLTYSYVNLQETKKEYLDTPGLPPSNLFLETVLINESLLAGPRKDYEKAIEQMEMVSNVFILYYAYNLIDFYFFHKKRENDSQSQIDGRLLYTNLKRERVGLGQNFLIEDKMYVYFQTSF
jgi:hypothetical protein